MPQEDMKFIIEERQIIPNKVDAWFASPSERLLKSRLNPETKMVAENELIESGNFITDDVSLSTFMKKLLQILF